MQQNDAMDDKSLVASTPRQSRAIEIPSAIRVRLQTMDLARHVAIAPNGKRLVVASYDDTRLGRGYVTAAMPQQNNYLTLIRLPACELTSSTPDEAIERHIALVKAIQNGKLNEFLATIPGTARLK